MLTEENVKRAAMACRVAAAKVRADAKAQRSPSVRQLFETEAQRFLELAEKLQRMG